MTHCSLRLGLVLTLALLAAGCTKGGQFDPSEFFSQDMFDTKKRLQGERKAVFPEGVPGASTGVPQELVKGYQPPEPPQAAAPPAEPEGAKAQPKPKPASKVVRAPRAPADDSVWNQKPAPSPTQIDIRPAPRPPAQTAQPAQPAQPAQSGSVWPEPAPRPPPAQNVWPDPPPVSR